MEAVHLIRKGRVRRVAKHDSLAQGTIHFHLVWRGNLTQTSDFALLLGGILLIKDFRNETGARPRPRLLSLSAARDRPGRRFWDALPHSGRRAPPPPWLPSNFSCARPRCTATFAVPLPPGSRG